MGCAGSAEKKDDLGPAKENVELKRALPCDRWMEGQLPLNGELLREKFVELDSNGQFQLSRDNLLTLYDDSERELAEKAVESMFQAAGVDGQGKLDWDKFVKWVGAANKQVRTGSIDAGSDGLLKRLNVNFTEWRDSVVFTRKYGNVGDKDIRNDVLRVRKHDGRVLLCQRFLEWDKKEWISDTRWNVIYGSIGPNEVLALQTSGGLVNFKCKWTDEWRLRYRRQVIQERYRTMEDEVENWSKIRGTPDPRKSLFASDSGWERVVHDESLASMNLCYGLDWPDGKHILKLVEIIAEAETRYQKLVLVNL